VRGLDIYTMILYDLINLPPLPASC